MTLTSTALQNNTELQNKIDSARARTDELFALLRPGHLYDRPVGDRHRLIFYLGHLEAFDWNQICRGILGMPSFHPEFDKLFEAGIDPEPGKAPHDQPSDWPAESEVWAYVAKVREKFDEVVAEAPQHLDVVVEHRYMHAETLAYLFHNLPYGAKQHPGQIPTGPRATHHETRLIPIPAGTATLGQAPGQFGWDNEFPRHSVEVPSFAVARYKVTNGEYLRFVEAGAKAPHFWFQENGEWLYRGMFEATPLPLDTPVYVTQGEAAAYAQWAGKSLLTEEQFHRAAYGTPERTERQHPWGDLKPDAAHGNFDFHAWDPEPVTAHPAGNSAFGVSQLVGNGWEWTSTPFAPFAGFQAFPFYPGYSANFFDNAHFVIKGASPRTAACFLRRSFRNWFRPNYPYVYAGFRLVEN